MNGPVRADDWDQHWGNYAESTESNPAQRYRTRLILRMIQHSDEPSRLVDIGSGQGDFLTQVRRRFPGAHLLGLELSETGCRIARRKVPDATFLQRDLLEPGDVPPEFRGWASHAVLSEVLEHVDRPDSLLDQARAYLAPGCRIVVTVPAGPVSAFDRHIGHRRHYTPEALEQLLRNSGLQVGQVMSAGFPFHNLYRLAVLARGGKLVEDVIGSVPPSILRRAATRSFDLAFRLNLSNTPWGWQLIAAARVPL